MDPHAPRETGRADERAPDERMFTGNNATELQRFIIRDIGDEIKDDTASPLLDIVRQLYLDILSIRLVERSIDNFSFSALHGDLRAPGKRTRTAVLHNAVQTGSSFAQIAAEVRERLFRVPHNLAGFLQATCEDFPAGITVMPFVSDLSTVPPLNDSRYASRELASIHAADMTHKTSLAQSKEAMKIMRKIVEITQGLLGKIAVGSQYKEPWKLRLFQLTFQPNKHFIASLYPRVQDRPTNVHCDLQYRPPDTTGYEAEPRIDDLVELQTWSKDFTGEDLEHWRKTIAECARDFQNVWVLCQVEQSSASDVIVKIYVHPKEAA